MSNYLLVNVFLCRHSSDKNYWEISKYYTRILSFYRQYSNVDCLHPMGKCINYDTMTSTSSIAMTAFVSIYGIYSITMNEKDATMEPELSQHKEDAIEAKRTGVRVV